MTHDYDRDFQQFRGAFDDAMIPDAAFKARMEKVLQHERGQSGTRQSSTIIASPSRKPAETVVPARRSHPLMVAVAVFLVFSVVATTVWFVSEDVLEGQYGNAPAGIATMPENAPGTPGADEYLTPEQIPGIPSVHQHFGMHGGLLILRTPVEYPQDQTQGSQEPNVYSDVLMAVDPSTGSIVWEQPYDGLYAFSSNDDVLVGIKDEERKDQIKSTGLTTIRVLDLHTGEQLWSESNAEFGVNRSRGLVVLGDNVITLQNENMAVARSITDGSVAWESTYDPGEGQEYNLQQEDGTTTTDIFYSVSAASWQDQLLILNGDGVIQVVDGDSGEITHSIELEWNESGSLHANNTDIVVADTTPILVQSVQGPDGMYTTLTAFDPIDGSTEWSRELEHQHFLNPVSGKTITPQSFEWKSTNWLMQLLGNHGTSAWSMTWIDATSGEIILETSPASFESFYGSLATTDDTYACTPTSDSEVSCYNTQGTRYIIEMNSVMDIVVIDGILFISSQDGLFKVELP